MKLLLTLTSFFTAMSVGHAAQQPLSEVLMQARCVPHRAEKTGEIENYHCGEAKTDSLQTITNKGTLSLSNADAFEAFDQEVQDPSQATAPEVEIVE